LLRSKKKISTRWMISEERREKKKNRQRRGGEEEKGEGDTLSYTADLGL